MVDKKSFLTTPMGMALLELGQRMQKENMPPVSLNVVGGFALMMREIRNPSDTTDIDYVGRDLPDNFNHVADEIGIKHHLGRGWINNDVMLSGSTLEDLEFSTGKLHFDPAFSVGNIQINVLDEKDLLRMKIISVDTSLTAAEMGGDFSRMKDLEDIKILMARQHIRPDEIEQKFGDYIIGENTQKIIETYHTSDTEGVAREVDTQQRKYLEKLQKQRQTRSVTPQRSDYMQNLLDNLTQRAHDMDDEYF